MRRRASILWTWWTTTARIRYGCTLIDSRLYSAWLLKPILYTLYTRTTSRLSFDHNIGLPFPERWVCLKTVPSWCSKNEELRLNWQNQPLQLRKSGFRVPENDDGEILCWQWPLRYIFLVLLEKQKWQVIHCDCFEASSESEKSNAHT